MKKNKVNKNEDRELRKACRDCLRNIDRVEKMLDKLLISKMNMSVNEGVKL